ncbi:cytochrome c oxidase assembly protein, partial [Streptomyces sp. SID625]|nr:cytochrome c oxidase assembly protein [Streptomyces sp. SID625]
MGVSADAMTGPALAAGGPAAPTVGRLLTSWQPDVPALVLVAV